MEWVIVNPIGFSIVRDPCGIGLIGERLQPVRRDHQGVSVEDGLIEVERLHGIRIHEGEAFEGRGGHGLVGRKLVVDEVLQGRRRLTRSLGSAARGRGMAATVAL